MIYASFIFVKNETGKIADHFFETSDFSKTITNSKRNFHGYHSISFQRLIKIKN